MMAGIPPSVDIDVMCLCRHATLAGVDFGHLYMQDLTFEAILRGGIMYALQQRSYGDGNSVGVHYPQKRN